MLNLRTLAAIAAVSLLSACGGEQSLPPDTAAPLAMVPHGAPLPSHAGLQGSACAAPACQQGPADLADEYRIAALERAGQEAAAEMPSYPHVPPSAMAVAQARPAEVLGTAAHMIVR